MLSLNLVEIAGWGAALLVLRERARLGRWLVLLYVPGLVGAMVEGWAVASWLPFFCIAALQVFVGLSSGLALLVEKRRKPRLELVAALV